MTGTIIAFPGCEEQVQDIAETPVADDILRASVPEFFLELLEENLDPEVVETYLAIQFIASESLRVANKGIKNVPKEETGKVRIVLYSKPKWLKSLYLRCVLMMENGLA